MGKALVDAENGAGPAPIMMGGGNPAHIPQVQSVWRQRMEEILADGDSFDRMLANYDSPQGKTAFLDAMALMLQREYGWNVDARNIAITNGSQSAFFALFNLFAGLYPDGSKRHILFPLVPEYIGYADQVLFGEDFVSCPPHIEIQSEHRFKYHVDFSSLQITRNTAAICISRPTNPSGNVVSDAEIQQLAALAREHDIPFIIDNAYGFPFPGIMFAESTPYWDPNVILCMSLSKLGLPSTRTGIIVASEPIIKALSSMTAIFSLANGNLGQVITLPMLLDGSILKLSEQIIKPYYQRKSLQAQHYLNKSLGSLAGWTAHQSEGAIFLWLWLRDLEVSDSVLYERLKQRKVVVVPGSYFFYGSPPHAAYPQHHRQCLRLSYAMDQEAVRRGIAILAEELDALAAAGT